VRAAAAAARALPFRFMLTARAENFITGRPDLADTIARLQAIRTPGADVLYAPAFDDARPDRDRPARSRPAGSTF
jgi:2-methylisocitrate lyase-like PEP mutase family enzyme